MMPQQSAVLNASMKYLEGLRDDKQALAWLDREVARALAELVILKALRNDRVTACRIPDEIIIEIAKSAQKDDSQSNEWIRFTHICGRWRRVIVETPLLWTCIQANNLERATAFLRRSHNASVDVALSRRLPEDQQLAFTNLINSQAHRIASLSLCLPSTDLAIISALLNSTLPQLRNLCLKDPRQQTLPGSYTPYRILFQPKCPSDPPLHTLILDGVTLPWDSPILRDLRVLEISRIRDPRTEQARAPQWLRLSQLLDTLQACPYLERLKVSTIGPATPDFRIDPQAPVGRIVPLRHLRELEVANSPGIIALLLSHLSIPPTTKTQLRATIFRTSVRNRAFNYVSPFPASCAEHLDCVSAVERLVLDFQWSRNTIVIQGGAADHTTTETGQTDNWLPVITTQIIWGATTADSKKQVVSSLAEDLGQIFHPYVQELVVRGCASFTRPSAWGALFVRFPLLTSLSVHLDGENPKGLWGLVEGLLKGSGSLLCPRLKELKVWGVELCVGGLADVYHRLCLRTERAGKLDSLGLWVRKCDEGEPDREFDWEGVSREFSLHCDYGEML